MKAVVTRVNSASVEIDGKIKASINKGFLILLGVSYEDEERDADKLAAKICSLRIFEDENEKMNLSLEQVGGELLVVSNFTLLASCIHGRRPDFFGAARPEKALPLYERFVNNCKNAGFKVGTGEFGAYMKLDSENDGPITLILDSKELK